MVTDASQIMLGERLDLRLHRGTFEAEVCGIKSEELVHEVD